MEALKNLTPDDAVQMFHKNGHSVLACAVLNLHFEFVQAFLAVNGARSDRFGEDERGFSPLQLAAANGDKDMITLLVRSGTILTGRGTLLAASSIDTSSCSISCQLRYNQDFGETWPEHPVKGWIGMDCN